MQQRTLFRDGAITGRKEFIPMSDMFEDFEDIARETERHFAIMQDLSDDEIARYAESVIRGHDIVLGTFVDPSSPAGIGVILIKGREVTALMRETHQSNGKTVTALPCQLRKLAVSAMLMWGDGAREQV